MASQEENKPNRQSYTDLGLIWIDPPPFIMMDEEKTVWYKSEEDRIIHRMDGPAVEWADGTIEYWEEGEYHRVGDPAIIESNGTQEYYCRGILHRADGPAIIRANGTLEYWFYGKLHREGAPAIIFPNGATEWWQMGKKHRFGGPAAEYPGGVNQYWIHNKRITEAEFKKLEEEHQGFLNLQENFFKESPKFGFLERVKRVFKRS